LISFTVTRPAGASTLTACAAPALGRSTGVNTLGRSDTTAGCVVSFTFSNAFPA